MRRFRFLCIGFLAAFLSLGPTAHAQKGTLLTANEISQAVDIVDELHLVLTDLMLSTSTDLETRKTEIAPAIAQQFDLEAMTKAIAGSRIWRGASPQARADAVAAFSDWTITQYASRFTHAAEPEFRTRSTRDGGRQTVVVETVLRTKKRVVNLDYRVRQNGEVSKIIDIYLDGRISEVALRKSEFTKTVRDGGLSALTAALVKKTQALAQDS